MLNVPVNNFSVILGRSHRFLGITSTGEGGVNMSCSRTQHGDPSGARTTHELQYKCCLKMSCVTRKLFFGVSDQVPHKLSHLGSKGIVPSVFLGNKGADQFRTAKSKVSHDAAQIIYHQQTDRQMLLFISSGHNLNAIRERDSINSYTHTGCGA